MASTSIVYSENNNLYYYDKSLQIHSLGHPLLHFFSKLDQKGCLYNSEEILPENIEFEEINYTEKEEIKHFYNKYQHLKKNGFFSNFSQEELLQGKLTSQNVKYALVNATHVVFELTDDCNLKCKYCGYGELYGDYDERKGAYLSFNTVKVLLDYLMELWQSSLNNSEMQSVTIGFYGGEPLLNMKVIKETVAYIKKINIPHRTFLFNMTTNAMLLHKHCDYLVENNFRLLISLDGNEYSQGYRVTKNGRNSFQTVFNNVKALQEKYPLFFSTNVDFNAVLHNLNTTAGIHEFILKEFNKVPSIAGINNSGIRPEMKDEFQKMRKGYLDDFKNQPEYEQIVNERFVKDGSVLELTRYLHHYTSNVFQSYDGLFSKSNKRVRIPTGTCPPFKKKIFLTVNGKILPCERISTAFTLGRIDNGSVVLDMENIANMYNKYFDIIKKQCLKCSNAPFCTECMFQFVNQDSNFRCPDFSGKDEFQKIISRNISVLEKKPHLYKKIMNEVFLR